MRTKEQISYTSCYLSEETPSLYFFARGVSILEYISLFPVQLAGCVGFGAFVGEFYRTVGTEYFSLKVFMANFLAGAFLAFLVSYIFYIISKQETLTMLLGALLAYQDEKFISRIVRRLTRELITGGGGGGNNQ